MTSKLFKPDQCGDDASCIGILLTNLGTPDAPTPKALRRYLAEFLWDPRIVDLPRPLWWLILHGVILRTRPKKSAKAYQRIWSSQGSPLAAIANAQAHALQTYLDARCASLPAVKVVCGMRYGNPSLSTALETLRHHHARRVLLLPLYPQYSAATTASTFDKVAQLFKKQRFIPEMRCVNQYAEHPKYIQALVNSIESHWQQHGRAQKLLFSFHGIPKRHFLEGDPYYFGCHQTASLVAEALKLAPEEWELVFQSRFGKEPWLQPYCDETLKQLPQQGIKTVDIICPGFSADCLETLDEIEYENQALFLESGGEALRYIPALNLRSDHIEAIADIVTHHIKHWC